MAAMELSLDDIIKSNPKYKKTAKPVKNMLVGVKKRSLPSLSRNNHGVGHIVDARQKIIETKRAKIRDVREIINKRKPDVRRRIDDSMVKRMYQQQYEEPFVDWVPRPMRKEFPRRNRSASSSLYDPLLMKAALPSRQYVGAPRGYVDHDAMVDTEPHGIDKRVPTLDSLNELITNYVDPRAAYIPAARTLPSLSRQHHHSHHHHDRRHEDDGMLEPEDAFDIYELRSRHESPLKMRTASPPSPHHHRSADQLRRYVPNDNCQLSYEMRSRLERSQQPTKSMGIFANPATAAASITSKPAPARPQRPATEGFKVVVTNLHAEVTVWDIKELFADIGGLISAEIVRPGVAEVVYRTLNDAEDAVEVYHNRQLDGQPMKCMLVPLKSSALNYKYI